MRRLRNEEKWGLLFVGLMLTTVTRYYFGLGISLVVAVVYFIPTILWIRRSRWGNRNEIRAAKTAVEQSK